MNVLPRATRLFPLLGLASALVLIPGCSETNSVSGKVTLKGEPVKAGFVTFIGEDNHRKVANIGSDGEYTLNQPPMGTVKVTVAGVTTTAPAPKAGQRAMRDVHGVAQEEGSSQAVPRRYADPNNGLTFNVTGGTQRFDIELTP
jgi:hypothetical protein